MIAYGNTELLSDKSFTIIMALHMRSGQSTTCLIFIYHVNVVLIHWSIEMAK